MEDKTLLNIAISVSIAGILALYVILRWTEPISAAPYEFPLLGSEDVIMLNGTVLTSSGNGKATFIEIQTASRASVTFFGDARLLKGDNISVIGRVQEHNSRRGVIAERVTKT